MGSFSKTKPLVPPGLAAQATTPPAALTGLLVSSTPQEREDDTHGPYCPRCILRIARERPRPEVCLPRFQQDLPDRQPSGHPRAAAHDPADFHAHGKGRHAQSADPGVRHLGPVQRPGRAYRPEGRPAGGARQVDRRARRHRSAARPVVGIRPRPRQRPGHRAPALCPADQSAPRQGRCQRVADALCAPRHHHA
ncbi:hypothetical protein D3C81_990320 [compost metagenome]